MTDGLGDPVETVPTITQLFIACERAGMTNVSDRRSAIETYVRRGTLSRADRAHLESLSGVALAQWLVDRYGVDAARVGMVAFQCYIGGGCETWAVSRSGLR